MKIQKIILLLFSIVIGSMLQADEDFEFQPTFRYRQLGLHLDRNAAFSKVEHQDNQQQIFISLLSKGSADFADSFVIEPVVRTRRTRFDETDPELLIDQAYITSSLTDSLEFYSGRRIHFEGSGLFVNPSDLLNEQKNLFDPVYERTGYILTSLTGIFGSHQFTLGVAPNQGKMLKKGLLYMRYSSNPLGVNTILKFKANEDEKSTWGLSLSKFLNDHVELHMDGRYQHRQRTSDLERERLFSELKPEDSSVYLLAGARYSFSFEHSLILEYVLNQSGMKKEEFVDFYNFIRTAADIEKEPDNRLVGREYLVFSYFHKELLKNTSLESSYVRNIQDDSGFVSVQLTRVLSRITWVEVRTIAFDGERDSEFGENAFPRAVYATVGASI